MSNTPAVLRGTVHGKTIELEEESGLPEGQQVTVMLESTPQQRTVQKSPLEALKRAAAGLDRLITEQVNPRSTDLDTKPALEIARIINSEDARVAAAVREKKPVPAETDGRSADGTIHLSAVDAQGTMVALTLTHGNSFGAMVTVSPDRTSAASALSAWRRPGALEGKVAMASGETPAHLACGAHCVDAIHFPTSNRPSSDFGRTFVTPRS